MVTLEFSSKRRHQKNITMNQMTSTLLHQQQPPPTTASYNPTPCAIDAPLCAINDMDRPMIVARTSDPRIYGRAAKLSTFPNRYVMDNVKYFACVSKDELPADLDKPIVNWQPFDNVNCRGLAQECSWFAYGGDASFAVDAEKMASIASNPPNCSN